MDLSDTIRLERPEDGVAVLRMDNGENRFTPEVNDHFNTLLDAVDADESIGSLVVTGTGKFFSNGFDIDALAAAGDDAIEFVGNTEKIWARLMAAPFTVVTAVNGHAFGAGAMLALAGDLRIGRTERGFWCLPEADLGMPFSPAMMALFDDVLGRPVVAPFMTTSARVPPDAQLSAGVVQQLVDVESLDTAALALAKGAAHRRGANLGRIKHLIHSQVIALAGRV
ncbi:MAG: enoyl-CoA hydratase/isomerase family protein [Acidimicrobiales bacterium]